MPRLYKQDKAAQTRAANAARNSIINKTSPSRSNKGKPVFTKSDRIKFITSDKIALLDHPATNKYWIGGKDSGKSRSVVVEELSLLESDRAAYALGLKKYKGGGIQRLHTAVNNLSLEIAQAGFDIPEYQKGKTETYRMTNKKIKQYNQTIEYSSFDDANGLAGIEAPNLGYFAIVHVEEPVLLNDEGKLPTPKEWNASMSTIKKSIGRSNRRFMMAHPETSTLATTYHYTLNPWDEHPIITKAEVVYPEEQFLEWCLKDIYKNHTSSVYDIASDSLYIRTTTLANPIVNLIEVTLNKFNVRTLAEWSELDKTLIDFSAEVYKEYGVSADMIKAHLQDYDGLAIWFSISEAIRTDNSLLLATFLGLRYTGTSANEKTYNLTNLDTIITEDVLKDKDVEVLGMAAAWDIDVRKGRYFVATPTYYIRKKISLFDYSYHVLIGRQRFIKAYGDSSELSGVYIQQMKKVLIQIKKETVTLTGKIKLQYGCRIYVDENKINYIRELEDVLGYWTAIGKAKKHKRWDIIHRQDNITLGIDKGFYVIDIRNEKLLTNMKRSYIKEGSKQRDESGRNEKLYDEINSMEYGIYPWRVVMYGLGTTTNKGALNDK